MNKKHAPLSNELANKMLETAYNEAVIGLSEGGIPIGAALFTREGELLGAGHNRRVQEDDASVHAETDAFRKAGRRRDYPDCVMVTTLSPCWYCSGLVVLNDKACIEILSKFTHEHPELWNEDIGL